MRVCSRSRRTVLFTGSAAIAIGSAAPSFAQESSEAFGISDIIVTAQKREQSLQDVPIAITAVNQETLQVNRVSNVSDLSAIAPNLTVLKTAGGAGIPTFGMRGLVSAGSVSGQDKSVSIYLDGVSIASALGSTFDLPDLERIEVLRGPQGTLFGRNSTGGAISVITRDPSGELGLRQEMTYGNLNQIRAVTRVELPAFGPFTASVSYSHNEYDGDIKNLAAGTIWDRRNAGMGTFISPKTLGAKNAESVFIALKFEPGDTFKAVYKFDWLASDFTADGGVLAVFNPTALGAATGGILQGYFDASPSPIAGAKRPKVANAWFTIPGRQRVQGHNLTSNLALSDSLSLKSILSYRKSFLRNGSDLTGLGGLIDSLGRFGPAGGRLVPLASQVSNDAKQWSAELQANYDSDFLTLTAGVNYFRYKGTEGAPLGIRRVLSFQNIPITGVLPPFPPDYNTLTTKSLAGFVQAEVHLTPQIDVIGGIRLTNDKKKGINYIGGSNRAFDFTYDDTKANYSIGANYKPNDHMMIYAKYATGFVAGGVTSTIVFEPETVKSWEAGLKADLLSNRVRFNLAVFKADYKNLQAVGSGATLPTPRPELGTIVITQGDLKTKGFEAELTAAPIEGLTFSGSLGYTDWKLSNLNPILGLIQNFKLNYRAHWTGTASAQYETEPLFGDATLLARIDGNWRSSMNMFSQRNVSPVFDDIRESPAGWVLNGRAALRHVELGRGNVEIAVWGKNLTNSDRPMFPLYLSFAALGTYETARTYGLDMIFNF